MLTSGRLIHLLSYKKGAGGVIEVAFSQGPECVMTRGDTLTLTFAVTDEMVVQATHGCLEHDPDVMSEADLQAEAKMLAGLDEMLAELGATTGI